MKVVARWGEKCETHRSIPPPSLGSDRFSDFLAADFQLAVLIGLQARRFQGQMRMNRDAAGGNEQLVLFPHGVDNALHLPRGCECLRWELVLVRQHSGPPAGAAVAVLLANE